MNPVKQPPKAPNWKKLKIGQKSFEPYFIREKVIWETRKFFKDRQFHEVETPILVPSLIPESYYDFFETRLNGRKGQSKKMYLTPSPELSLKKLIVAGIGNCFEITRSFRNGETDSTTHNPEFTMLELYQVGADYGDIMALTEQWLAHLSNQIFQSSKITYQSKKIDLAPPWERISIVEAFKKFASIDLVSCLDPKEMTRTAITKGYTSGSDTTWEQLFNQILLNEIEPHLGTHGKPTILYDYPASLAALAKLKENDPRFAERFEVYIAGLELGDCYSELTEYETQKIRFDREQGERARLGKEKIAADDEFLKSLKIGLPRCSGIAVGLDRLCMLFTDSVRLEDVLFFPCSDWEA